MPTDSPVRHVWWREGWWAAAGLTFSAATLWLGRTLPQFNDSEALQTLVEADALAAGFHRWGLLEYTHHPLGRTYLLLPFVYAGLYAAGRYVPVVIAALCGGLALWVLLRRAPTWLLRVAVVAVFAALLAQPGYIRWVGNLHQHSYNLSVLLLLVYLSVQLERAPWLAVAGFLAGCIGYDFFFAQVCTVLTLRLAFWNGRRDAAPFEQLLAAGGDTAAFLLGFFSATLLHYAQNVLYFSSATMAYHDLFGSLESRLNIAQQSATRLQEVDRLARIYVGKFLAPGGKWSHPASLAAAGGVLIAAALHGLVRRLRGSDRPAWTIQLWNAFVAVLVLAGSVGTVLVWFYAVPFHASPHQHLFPRMLLIPLIVAAASLVLVLSPARVGGAPAMRRSAMCLGGLAVLVAVNWFGPSWSAAAIDARLYDRTWINTHDVADAGSMSAPLLKATPAASSVDPHFDLGGPLKVKSDVEMVGRINIWGTNLEADPSLRWAPLDPGPSWYEQRFGGLAQVTDATIRVWGLPHLRGAETPALFTLSSVASDGMLRPVRRYPDPDDPPVLQGKYIVFHYRFDPPVSCTALRLDFDRTIGGGPPVLFDFQAFGTI